MNKYIIEMRNFDKPAETLDNLLIPNEIYSLTINKEKLEIQKYFIENPDLLYQFVGFNSKLKTAATLSSNRKCGCFYQIPWITKYANDNNLDKTILLFNQQVLIYEYIIKNWYPSPTTANLRFLSNIALEIIQDLRRFNYNQQNNLNYLFIFNKPWSIWKNVKEVNNYLDKLKTL